VKFSSSPIEGLSATSRNHKVLIPEEKLAPEKIGAAYDADQALSGEIRATGDALMARLPSWAHKVIHRYDTLPLLALSVTKESLDILEARPEVEAIFPDKVNFLPEPIVSNHIGGKGSSLSQEIAQPQLLDTVNIIGASTAWSRGYSGLGWYVAILDTGIRSTHQFFYNKTIVEACFASGQSGSGDCPNGTNTMYGAGSASHYPSTYSGYDHGTHVSGIAAGHRSDGGLNGIAKDANIIAVKIFSKFYDSTYGYSVGAWTSDIIQGLNYIYSLRSTYSIAGVNMSLGGGQYSSQSACDLANGATKTAIDNLKAVNIATAIATGNNGWCGSVSSPGCISSAISVGSSTKSDVKSGFSNWDSIMQDLFAPGESIYSSTGGSDSSYQYWSGTSMATPHITGAWAILRQARPTSTVDQLLSALSTNGVSIPTSCSIPVGSKPRIQLDRALDSLNPMPTVTTGSSTNVTPTAATLNGTVNPNGLSTTYYFQWGTTASYGNSTSSQSAGSGTSPIVVSANLSSLTMSSIYHYRLVGTNSSGTIYGSDMTFTTLGPPGSASLVTPWGTMALTSPTFYWNAVSNATQYNLYVNDSTGNKVNQWYTAAQAGCVSGTGICSATPSSILAQGSGDWKIQTQNSWGLGPWSSILNFTIVASATKVDFNSDGQADILWRNKTSGAVAVWYMTGTPAAFSSAAMIYPSAPLDWDIAGTGDFNGDGQTDILWRNKTSGAVAVWYMNGSILSSTALIYQGVDLDWEIVGTGDFNNDGKTDLLWKNKKNGNVAVWYMNGSTLNSSALIYQGVALSWDIVGR
jgi:subtilisin family serine protease